MLSRRSQALNSSIDARPGKRSIRPGESNPASVPAGRDAINARIFLPDIKGRKRHQLMVYCERVVGAAGFESGKQAIEDMAERVGFEPTVEFPPLRFSRPVH